MKNVDDVDSFMFTNYFILKKAVLTIRRKKLKMKLKAKSVNEGC